MFRKLYQPSSKPTTYSQQSAMKSKMKQISYSRMHKAKRTPVSSSLDFHVVSNQSYIYQGQWAADFRDGEGIAYCKNGCMIVAHWCKDHIHGRALIFTPFGALISANFINGKLNGWVLALYRDKVVILNLYFEDKVDGPRIMYEGSEQLWLCSLLTNNGQLIKMSRVVTGQRLKLPGYVQDDDLAQLFNEIVIKKNYSYSFHKIKTMKVTAETDYIGFVEGDVPNGLGATYSIYQCFVGHYKDGYLEGLGRMIFANGDIYHGGLLRGQFEGNGIYYNPKKNTTLVVLAGSNIEAEVLEEQEGYYLVDFEQKVGQRINKQDKINLSLALQNFIKMLEKYYHQYYVEARIKNQQDYSNVSQHASEQQRLHEISEQSQDRMIKIWPVKWISGEQNENAQSAQGSMNGVQNQQAITLKYQSKNKSKSGYYSPKNMTKIDSQFNSLSIKENQELQQKEKFNKQDPKVGGFKKGMFQNGKFNDNASQSLDVNQLTFRGSARPNEGSIQSGRTGGSGNIENEIEYSNFQQRQSRFGQSQDYEMSEKNSSNVSHLDEKISGMMKKSNFRRKIFS